MSINGNTAVNHIDAIAATGSGSWESAGSIVGVYAAWTGTISGTLTLEGSQDCVTAFTVATFASSPAGSASNNGGEGWSSFAYRFVRVLYTHSSGTGTVTCDLTTKA